MDASSSISRTLQELTKNVPLGETLTTKCPYCHGGRTGERSFSCTRTETGLLFCCHRASCRRAGFYPVVADAGQSLIFSEAESGSVKEPRYFKGNLGKIPANVLSYLKQRYALTSWHVERGRIRWVVGEDTPRLWFPLLRRDGTTFGGVARAVHKGVIPKVVSYIEDTKEPIMSWYTNPLSDHCIIVEDQLSAIRISKYHTGVALMGTHLSLAKAVALREEKLTNYWLALDADATVAAAALVTKYSKLLPIKLMVLDKDFKDKKESELLDTLHNQMKLE